MRVLREAVESSGQYNRLGFGVRMLFLQMSIEGSMKMVDRGWCFTELGCTWGSIVFV